MNIDKVLHVVRNPSGFDTDTIREARIRLADAYENAIKNYEIAMMSLSKLRAQTRSDNAFCYCGVMLPKESESHFCVRCQTLEDAKQINKLLKAQNEIFNRS